MGAPADLIACGDPISLGVFLAREGLQVAFACLIDLIDNPGPLSSHPSTLSKPAFVSTWQHLGTAM
jgi:hypothetical protein